MAKRENTSQGTENITCQWKLLRKFQYSHLDPFECWHHQGFSPSYPSKNVLFGHSSPKCRPANNNITMKTSNLEGGEHNTVNTLIKYLPHQVSNQKPHKPSYGVRQLYPARINKLLVLVC